MCICESPISYPEYCYQPRESEWTLFYDAWSQRRHSVPWTRHSTLKQQNTKSDSSKSPNQTQSLHTVSLVTADGHFLQWLFFCVCVDKHTHLSLPRVWEKWQTHRIIKKGWGGARNGTQVLDTLTIQSPQHSYVSLSLKQQAHTIIRKQWGGEGNEILVPDTLTIHFRCRQTWEISITWGAG